ncbi:hypothetical protein TNCV_935721 [Trichonephila clavipes]|nr:hypothetical protein TNCV_935721 [Trichonephila clavipes]
MQDKKQLNSSVGTKQLNSTGEKQLNSAAGTKANSASVSSERVGIVSTQLVSRNEASSTSALTSTAYDRLQRPTTALQRLQPLYITACNRLQPPATACSRLQPPCGNRHRLPPFCRSAFLPVTSSIRFRMQRLLFE